MLKSNVILLCILSGCASTTQHSVRSNANNWTVAFTPVPEEMPLNEVFEITTWVTGSGEVQSLRVDAAMPGHGHGMMTTPVTTLQPDGSYLTSGMLLHMPGAWEVYFDILYEDDIIERAQTSLTLDP